MFEPGFCRLLFVWPGFVSWDGPGAFVFNVLCANRAGNAVMASAAAKVRILRFISSSSPRDVFAWRTTRWAPSHSTVRGGSFGLRNFSARCAEAPRPLHRLFTPGDGCNQDARLGPSSPSPPPALPGRRVRSQPELL